MTFTFRHVEASDIPLLYEWMQRPHVAEWWKSERTLEEVREAYLPRLERESDATPYFAYHEGRAVAYVGAYVVIDVGNGWWAGQHDRGVMGMDVFIADAENVGRGLGTALVRAFAVFLFSDPAIHRIQVDPSPDNHRAIRCYEKAGFRRDREIVTPDGPSVLLVLDRVPA